MPALGNASCGSFRQPAPEQPARRLQPLARRTQQHRLQISQHCLKQPRSVLAALLCVMQMQQALQSTTNKRTHHVPRHLNLAASEHVLVLRRSAEHSTTLITMTHLLLACALSQQAAMHHFTNCPTTEEVALFCLGKQIHHIDNTSEHICLTCRRRFTECPKQLREAGREVDAALFDLDTPNMTLANTCDFRWAALRLSRMQCMLSRQSTEIDTEHTSWRTSSFLPRGFAYQPGDAAYIHVHWFAFGHREPRVSHLQQTPGGRMRHSRQRPLPPLII